VKLEVEDTGTGIALEAMVHLFEPFFTTKDRGRGTGLGLSTVYGIVEQSGGRISIASPPGQGACVRIHLPASRGLISAAEPSRPPETGCRASAATILLVEDEDDVRSVLAEALNQKGYATTGAADPAQALSLEENLGRLDLLITDMVMPGMDGKQLAKALVAKRPGLPVLFMSGFTEALGEEEAQPFLLPALFAKVAALLAARPGQAGQQ
jgi:two-component system cell cycle sensor histidine kinase/response regulator CckA